MTDDTMSDAAFAEELAALGAQVDTAVTNAKKDLDEVSLELDTNFAATDKALNEFTEELERGEEEE